LSETHIFLNPPHQATNARLEKELEEVNQKLVDLKERNDLYVEELALNEELLKVHTGPSQPDLFIS
jgi:hypothetical protein